LATFQLFKVLGIFNVEKLTKRFNFTFQNGENLRQNCFLKRKMDAKFASTAPCKSANQRLSSLGADLTNKLTSSYM